MSKILALLEVTFFRKKTVKKHRNKKNVQTIRYVLWRKIRVEVLPFVNKVVGQSPPRRRHSNKHEKQGKGVNQEDILGEAS